MRMQMSGLVNLLCFLPLACPTSASSSQPQSSSHWSWSWPLTPIPLQSPDKSLTSFCALGGRGMLALSSAPAPTPAATAAATVSDVTPAGAPALVTAGALLLVMLLLLPHLRVAHLGPLSMVLTLLRDGPIGSFSCALAFLLVDRVLGHDLEPDWELWLELG